MVNKKKKVVVWGLLVLVVIYVAVQLYISAMAYGMVKEIYRTSGTTTKYNASVSDQDLIDRLNFSVKGDDCFDVETEKATILFPWGYHFLNKATVWYMYSYEAFDKDGNEIAGTQNSIVELNLEFQSGRWILVNKLEEP